MNTKIIFIDNFDSFSYNLVDELQILGAETIVYRNDIDPKIVYDKAVTYKNEGYKVLCVLSPGPSSPTDANNLMAIIDIMKGSFPLLGICLGHQALGLSLGGKVVQAKEIAHAQASYVTHEHQACFTNLPSPLRVARYHSLVVTDLPQDVKVVATCNDIVMALYKADLKILGLQFHPESILTTYGRKILKNAVTLLCD